MAAKDNVSSLVDQLHLIGDVISDRADQEEKLDTYYEGETPIPPAIVEAKVTNAYRMLMGLSVAPWGSLVVDSVLDRLEVTGINTGDPAMDDRLWEEVWQTNYMDSETKLSFNASLVCGRSFALIWPNVDSGAVEICMENASQMAVMYEPGSRHRRLAAMRYWEEGERSYANLYHADAIYKFIAPEDSGRSITEIEWEPIQSEDEDWPVENPFGVVPVVELPVNRRLKPGQFGYARGEYEHATSLIDRINLITFLGVVVAVSLSFPLRGVIGEKIRHELLTDDEGNAIIDDETGREETIAIPPFEAQIGGQFQLENPDAKLASFPAADRSNLSIVNELDQLASVCKMPRHYLPLGTQGMANLSADTIRASESSLVSKIPGHKSSLGEGLESMMRVSGLMLDDPIEVPQTAEMQWADHETRSLAERADAAVKLKGILPEVALLEYVLNATSEQLTRWEAQQASSTLAQLIRAASTPAPTPAPAPTNGSVPPVPAPAG